ncbi:MAG: hypothetical protein K6B75_01585 [Lachnospiraceae bacterium]|nr:hypothetical protein [Lachnospiraceae bacterium]
MEAVTGILCKEYEYAKKLSEYINAKKDYGSMAASFAGADDFKAFYERKDVKTFLFDEDIYLEEGFPLALRPGTECILLCENKEESYSLENGMRRVFKYKPAGEILKEIGKEPDKKYGKWENVFAYFSPDAAILAAVKGFACAKQHALSGRTLFLSWEPFGGLGREASEDKEYGSEEKASLSELLFRLRKSEDEAARLFERTCKTMGVDYFCGPDYCSDLWQFSAEEMCHLVSFCKERGGYEYVILAVGFFSESMEGVMKRCEKVVLITLSGSSGRERKREFYRQMKYAGNQELLDNIIEEDEDEKKMGGKSYRRGGRS